MIIFIRITSISTIAYKTMIISYVYKPNHITEERQKKKNKLTKTKNIKQYITSTIMAGRVLLFINKKYDIADTSKVS